MASKRRLRRKSCASKNRHQTAWGAAIELSKAPAYKALKMHTYKCGFCGGWHVGHEPARSRIVRLIKQADEQERARKFYDD